jgi:hypothetical protein
MQRFEITEELAKKILDYLAERPYKEVMVLIMELAKIKRLDDPMAPPVTGPPVV